MLTQEVVQLEFTRALCEVTPWSIRARRNLKVFQKQRQAVLRLVAVSIRRVDSETPNLCNHNGGGARSTFQRLCDLGDVRQLAKKGPQCFQHCGPFDGLAAPAASSDALPSVLGHLATPST
jgi:hypothetical protein